MFSLHSDLTKRIMQAAGLITSALGAAVLIGWYIHSSPLIQVFPTLAPMQRMTALGFLLSGLGLIFASAGRKAACAICALIVLLQAVLVLLEYALHVDFGLDQLMGSGYITVHTSHAGRMSPISALCFIGSALALLAGISRKPARYAAAIVGILGSVITAVGAVTGTGYFLVHTEAYALGGFTSMALHTAAAFTLIGAGFLVWAWRLGEQEKGAPRWLALSLGAGLITGVLGAWRALIAAKEGDLPLLSHTILACGLLGALLVAVSIAQAQKARQRSRELQASNTILNQLFDVAPDGLLMTDHQGVITRANERAERILGYAKGELPGQPIEKLLPERLRNTHRMHREGYYARPTPRPMGEGLELSAVRKDLSEFPVEIALTPIRTSEKEMLVMAVVRDISERKQAEETLRLSEERFRSVFQQGPVGVALIGMDRRMIMVNSEFCRMLGYSQAEMATMTPLDITHPEDREESAEFIGRLFQNALPSGKLEKRYVKKNGDFIWGNLTASVIRDRDGKPLYSVGMIEDITERKHAEAALAESERAFVTLANCVPQVVWICTPDGLNVYLNQRWVEYTGLTLEESYGGGWITPFHPDDKQVAWDAWKHATATGETYRLESRLRAADGSYRWFLMSGLPLRDNAGNIVKWFGTCTDIEELKRAEQKLKDSEARLKLQIDRMPISCIVFSTDLRILSWNPAAEKVFGFGAQEVLGRYVCDCIVPPELRPQIDSLAGRLSDGDETAHSTNENLTKDGRRITCAWTNTPLRESDGTVYGILSMVQDITERKQAQEALRESEERFRSMFEQGPLGVTLTGIDGRFIKVNSAICRMLGYSEAELTGMTPLDISHPDDRQLTEALIQGVAHGEFTDHKVEKRYIKKNGETVWANLSVAVIRDREGRPLYAMGMLEDITERRRAEAEIRLGNEIFANMEEAVCLVRVKDGIIVHANPRFEKMFGYQPGELTGQPVEGINATTPQHPEEVAEEIRQEIRHSGVWRGEILHRRKDATPLWCAVSVSMFHHPDFGEVGISIYQDITDLKKAQETLRESEERFRGVFEQGPIGVALLDADHRMSKTNPAFRRMLGYSEEELARMTPLDMTHPDDREYCTGLLKRLDTGEIPFCKMEKRYRKKNGEIMWASLTASVVRDREGRPVHGLGLVEDITERRQAQQKLAEQAALLNLAHDSIAVRDLEGRIIFWNRGARDTYGWTADEAMGQMAHELLQGKYPVPRKDIEAAVLTQGHWEGELEQTTRDGRLISVDSRWSLWRDENGAPKAILVINRDITSRKEAEEQLRSLSERLFLATHIASIGVWDRDLRTNRVVWDDTLFEIFGIPKAVPIAYEDFARRVHPDDLARMEASVGQTIKNKIQGFVDFRIIRPDGSIRHISSAQGTVLDEHGNAVRLVGTGVDITERKQAEAQLRSLTERLALATRTSSIGIWDWDLRTNLVVWDDTLFEIFGIPKMVPMPYQEFAKCVHPEDVAKVEQSLRRAIEGETQAFVEFRIIRPDGSIRHVYAAQGAVRDEKGNAVRVVGTGVDISERKHMEAQIEASKVQLITSARLSALGMMAGNIAHEINNPVGIIHALSSDLIDAVKEEGAVAPEMVMRNSTRIRETAERISRIIKSMRQISREGATDKLQPTPVGRIVDETLEICRERFRANAVHLLLPERIPELNVSCREVRIAQVLLNLLQNAFDAVAEQPGERWVRLEVIPSDDSVVISVTDNGPGIPTELRPRLMEPFFTTKPVGKGTGLGLSLSKTIAEEHGGRLEYTDHQGHTRFSLILPLAREAEAVWS